MYDLNSARFVIKKMIDGGGAIEMVDMCNFWCVRPLSRNENVATTESLQPRYE